MEDSQERKRRKEKSDEYYKDRKSRKHSSKSPERHRDRDRDSVRDASRKRRRSRSPKRDERRNEGKMEAPPRKSKTDDMLNTRTGGAYIPPARLRMMQAQITDKSSVAYQRLAWEALKKSIHGHINKINVGNIGIIIKELLKENIVRGRGLLCRSVIQAQAASPTFTNVYAALVAAVNSRFPNIGELLLKRLVIQFKRGFKRNDKAICISSASFVAHLVNQRVAHEILALELLTLLVETPSDDSVEVAIAFLKECGQKLTEVSSKGVNAIFEMLRNILHEGQLDKRVQYMIEVMFQVWKDGFKDHPSVIEELELVPEEEQFTHLLMLDEATDAQDILNVFKFDEKYEDNEQKYKTLSKEILGSDAESGEEEDGSAESGSDESDDEEDEQKPVTIIDNTETNLIALRRTIYLTINSSLDFEECAHKLMKMQLKPGQEIELCHMFLDCCAEQRTYEKFYGLLAQRFCNINRIYIGPFEEIFKDSYATAHRLDTNRLRNISKFFAHLLFTDSISWEALDCVKLNEEDTTSSSRIYIKILFQELAEYMGLKKLNDRLRDQTLQEAFLGIFPRDNPKNTRFSINFFTSIGLGGLTDDLREHLKQMPKNVPAPAEIKVHSDSSSDSSSSSSSSSSDSSSSDSEEDTGNGKNKTKKKGSNAPNSPKDNPGKTSNEEERWGHDGYFERYGREEQRSDREGRSKRGEFARPKDVSKHTKDTQGSNDNLDIKQKNALEKGKTHQKRKEYANKKEINDSDVRCRSDSEQAVKEQTPIYDSYWSSTSRKKGNDSSKDRDDEYRHRDKNSRGNKDLDRDDYKESDKRSEKERNENRSRDKYEKRNHQKSIVNTSSDEQRKFDGNMKSSIKRDSKYQEKLLETSSRNTSRPEKSSHVDRGIIADKGFHSEKGKTDKNKSYKRHYKHNRDVQLTQDEESSDDSQNDSSDEKTYGKHNLKPMGDSDDSKSGRTPEQDSDSRNKRDKYVEKENGEPKIGRYWDSYDTQKSRDSQRQSRHKREIKSRR